VLRERRAVVVQRMGGFGKSAMAVHAAQRLHGAATFPQGILWVGGVWVAPLSTLCDAIARELGEPDIAKLLLEAKPTATRVSKVN
jgi:hypothetical protein